MKTINKKTILAGLLAVAALVPAEAGAFSFNLPKLFAMAPRMLGSAFENLISLLAKHNYEVSDLRGGGVKNSIKNVGYNVGDFVVIKQVTSYTPLAMRQEKTYGTATEYGFKDLATFRETFPCRIKE